MRFYKLFIYWQSDETHDYEWHVNKREALKRKKLLEHYERNRGATITFHTVDITPTKKGILSALRQHSTLYESELTDEAYDVR